MAHYQHLSHPSHPSDSEDFFSPDPRNRDPTLPPPPPSDRELDSINLSVLQRYLPSAEKLEAKAPYAVVYVYGAGSDEKEPGWEKTGVEGTVFVLRLLREGAKYEYAVVVLNRRGMDNWVMHLESKDGVQLTEEYIILQGTGEEEEKVYGLWIFEELDKSTRGLRERIGKCIVKCAAKAEGKWEEGINDGEEQPAGQANGSNGQKERQMGQRSPDLMAILNPPRSQASQQPDPGLEVNILDGSFPNGGNKAQ